MIVKSDDKVSIVEFKRLLFSLRDLRPDICVRLRLLGELWQTHHMRIIALTENGVVLNDESSNKLVFIQDLNTVMQFELDHTFQQYQPHYHYNVEPVAYK